MRIMAGKEVRRQVFQSQARLATNSEGCMDGYAVIWIDEVCVCTEAPSWTESMMVAAAMSAGESWSAVCSDQYMLGVHS